MDDNLPNVRNASTSDDQGMKVVPLVSGGMAAKEMEMAQIAKSEAYLDEAEKAQELPPELEKAGVEQVQSEVLIPQQVSQMGVKQTGPTAPVSTQVSVKLPITDDQVLAGMHANIFDAIRWLSEWCKRQLKLGHLALKKVGGKVVRVPSR